MLKILVVAGFICVSGAVQAGGFFHRVTPDEMERIQRQNDRIQWREDHPYDAREYRQAPGQQPQRYSDPRGQVPLIRVTGAEYGERMKCDATHAIRYMCNDRRVCEFEVTNSICGDPAPGKRKILAVEYLCGSDIRYSDAAEHQHLFLACD